MVPQKWAGKDLRQLTQKNVGWKSFHASAHAVEAGDGMTAVALAGDCTPVSGGVGGGSHWRRPIWYGNGVTQYYTVKGRIGREKRNTRRSHWNTQ